MESQVYIIPKSQYSDLYKNHIKDILDGDVMWWYRKYNQRKNIPSYTIDDWEDIAYFYAHKISALQNMWNIKEFTGKLTDQHICEFWILSLLNRYLLNPFTLPNIKVTTISFHENNEKKDEVYSLVQEILASYNGFSLKEKGRFAQFIQVELDKIFTVVDRVEEVKNAIHQEYSLGAIFAEETLPNIEHLQQIWVCDKDNILNCIKVFFMQNKYCIRDIYVLFKKDNIWFLRYLKARYSKQMQTYHADKNQGMDDSQKKIFDEITKKYTTAYSTLKKYLQEKI